MTKPFDLNSDNYIHTKLDDNLYAWERVTPFTAVEKSISRKKRKGRLKIKIHSNETPEEVAEKIKRAIEKHNPFVEVK